MRPAGRVAKTAFAASGGRTSGQHCDGLLWMVVLISLILTVAPNLEAAPAAIVVQPQNRTVVEGANHTFTVNVTGTAPLTFQWIKDGSPLTGAVGSTLGLSSIQTNQAGSYTVFVSNAGGSVTSAVARLTVRRATDPLYPAPQAGWAYLLQGDATADNQSASLDGNWDRQNGLDAWAGDGRGVGNGPIGGVGATNGILSVEDALASGSGYDNRRFYFTHDLARESGVTNASTLLSDGVTLTFRARLTPPTDPLIEMSDAPNGWINNSDGKGVFGIRQSGGGGMAIAFSLNKAVEDLDAGSSFSFPQAGLHMNNLNGDTPSAAVDPGEGGTLNLRAIDPTAFHEFWITIRDNGASPGTHQVSVYLDGSKTPSIFNVTAGSGSDGPFANYLALGLGSTGQRGAVDIDFFGYTPGVIAPAAFNEPVIFISQPTDQFVATGQAATFTSVLNGTPPYSFQWYRNGAAIPGATNASYTTPPAVSGDDGTQFVVVAANDVNSITSSPPARLRIGGAPLLATQPQSLIVARGDNASFSVAVSSPTPPVYQWRFNGANISNATNAALALNAVTPASAGNYDVVVANTSGSTTSGTATLTVRELDFGDALEPGYPTTLAGGGARHAIVPGVFLGSTIDAEIDGQPNANANGDDADGNDDEDGVIFQTPLRPGQLATVQVVASVSGVLNAWIDFDGNGSWGGVGDQIFTNRSLIAGGNTLQFRVPVEAVPGSAFARFRFSTTGGVSFFGPAADGEVEDYKVAITPAVDLVVTQTDTPDPVPLGSNLTYRITVSNAGASPASGVTLNDTLPAGTAFVSATTSQGSCGQNAGQVTCSLGFINSGSSVVVDLQLIAASAGTLVNTATASSVEADLDSSNNTRSEITSALAPALILTPPQNQTVIAGTTATFTVNAAGDGLLAYQWRRDGTDLPGQTGSTLTISNVQAIDAAGYSVRVSNPVSSAVSVAATLTVLVTPTILTQPASQTNFVGSTVSFSAVAAGSAPLSYQWLFNNNPITNATSATFVGTGVQTTNAGVYQLRVTNQAGSILSAPAVLTVIAADFGDAPNPAYPTLLAIDGARHRIVSGVYLGARVDAEPNGQPNSSASGDDLNTSDDEDGVTFLTALQAGQTANIQVVASTNGLLNAWIDFNRNNSWTNAGEQIFTNVALMPGTNVLSIRLPASVVPGTSYSRFRFSTAGDLLITGEAPDGEVEDYPLTLTGAVDLRVTALDSADPVAVGSNLTYAIVVSNAGPSTAAAVSLSDTLPGGLNFVSVSSSQGSCSVVGAAISCGLGAIGATGSATVNIVVAPNSAGTVVNDLSASSAESDLNPSNNSASVTTTVLAFPQIIAQPQGLAVTNGSAASLSVSAVGTTLRYQWQLNGLDVAGATNPVLNIANAQLANAGSYIVRITNEVGAVSSGVATLNVVLSVSLLSQPQNTTVSLGGTAIFSVSAMGTGPLIYQWQFDGADLGGENSSTLVIANAQFSRAGVYRVRVSNGVNSLLSNPATLTVRDAAAITQQPQSRTNIAGTIASFSVVATGLPPVLHQWYFNQGTLLAGQTGATLVLPNVQKPQGGDYFVVVSDSRGAVTSAVAVLTVYEVDFGDAPESLGYQTTLAFNGARHRLLPGVFLGAGADFEADGQPNDLASGDDLGNADEDGVRVVGPLLVGQTGTVSVVASTNGFINAWIDFSRDGTWTETGDSILASRPVSAGTNLLTFQVPAAAISTNTFARFRFSTAGGLSYDGFANDGEVEDYSVLIQPAIDLVVTQSDSPDPVVVNNNLTYTITVTNRGPSAASSVALANILPASVTFLSATSLQGSCSHANGRVTCALGAFGQNGGTTITLNVRANVPGTLLNTASAGAFEAEVNPVDNTATQATTVVVPPLTFANLAQIPVSDGAVSGPGTGNPYPSTITISGLTGAVHSVTVTLSNLTHPFPNDLDILLVGPRGQSVMLVSDAGAGFGVTNITFTLDDAAASTVPNGVALMNGATYRPASYELGTDLFPPPAPAAPSGTNLAVFHGSDPNGVWSLYVIDDSAGDIGGIFGGWRLDVSTSEPLTDLSATITSAPSAATVLSDLTYSVTVTNRGPSAAGGVRLTDVLPPGVSFVSAAASQGLCTNQSGVATCDIGNLAPNASVTASFTLRSALSGQLTNSFTVSGGQLDLVSSNNSAIAVTTIQPATDLALGQTASPAFITLGQSVTFTLNATNRGPSPSANVRLTHVLPAGANFVSATPSQGSCVHSGSSVSCNFGPLAAGATASASIVVTPTVIGGNVSTGQVASDELDPIPTNNTATATTIVGAGTDLALGATASPSPVEIGGNLIYTVAITNLGPFPASGVQLTNPLPSSVTFLSANTSQGSCGQQGGIVSCAIGGLAAGASVTVTITIIPNQAGQLTNRMGVFGSGQDLAPDNNAATVVTTTSQMAGIRIVSITHTGATASISFTTQSGLFYTLEYKNSVDAPSWSALHTVAGMSGTMTIHDTSATGPGRIYRVRVDTQPQSRIVSISHAGGTTSVSFTTMVGFVFTLEYKAAVDSPAWSALHTTIGTGSAMTIQDTMASGPGRVYRIRVEVLMAPRILSIERTNTTASISFTTQAGLSYTVEYKNTVDAPAWTVLNNVAGTGGTTTVQDISASVPGRIYRIRLDVASQSRIVSISHAGGTTSISFTTQAGLNHTVEFKNTLIAPAWSALSAVAGTGGTLTLQDTSASAPSRFYRVRIE